MLRIQIILFSNCIQLGTTLNVLTEHQVFCDGLNYSLGRLERPTSLGLSSGMVMRATWRQIPKKQAKQE